MLCETKNVSIQKGGSPYFSAQSSTEIWQAVIAAPFGKVGIVTTDHTISKIAYLEKEVPEMVAKSALAQRVVEQLKRYFDDPSFAFNLPLAQAGTSFQRGVWQAICAIPLGKTATYGQLAKQLGSGPRAVGQACGINPLPLIVPCHRVVPLSGGIGGFAKRVDADWQQIKRWLLVHEGAIAPGTH